MCDDAQSNCFGSCDFSSSLDKGGHMCVLWPAAAVYRNDSEKPLDSLHGQFILQNKQNPGQYLTAGPWSCRGS